MQQTAQPVTQQRATTLNAAQYTTSNLPESTRGERGSSYDSLRWANSVDNSYYLGSSVSLSTTSQMEYTTPTDQDMVDFLTEALPDIWMPEAMPQFDSLTNSMILGDCGQNNFQAADTSGNTGSSTVIKDYQNEREANTITVAHSEIYQSGETNAREENSSLNVPRAVVDNL